MLTVRNLLLSFCPYDLKGTLQKIILLHRVGYCEKDGLITYSLFTLHYNLRVSLTDSHSSFWRWFISFLEKILVWSQYCILNNILESWKYDKPMS